MLNAGRGGLAHTWNDVERISHAYRLDIILVSEAYPTGEGQAAAVIAHSVLTGDTNNPGLWSPQWVQMRDCRPATWRRGEHPPHSQDDGSTQSGGVLALINRQTAYGLTLVSTVATPTTAADGGDTLLFKLTYSWKLPTASQTPSNPQRLYTATVAGVYLLPAKAGLDPETRGRQRGICRGDTDCTLNRCWLQHPLRSLNRLLSDTAAQAGSDTCIVGGDLNTHLLGPHRTRSSEAAPNAHSRRTAVQAALDTHGFVATNGMVQGCRRCSDVQVRATRPARRPNDSAGTLDYTIVPHAQQNRVHNSEVYELSQNPNFQLDHPASFDHHLLVTTVYMTYIEDHTQKYTPSAEALRVPVEVVPQRVYHRPPAVHREWSEPSRKLQKELYRWMQLPDGCHTAQREAEDARPQHPSPATAEPSAPPTQLSTSTQTGENTIFICNDVCNAYSLWISVADQALEDAGLSRLSATRHRTRFQNTLEGQFSLAKRSEDRMKRLIKKKEKQGVPVSPNTAIVLHTLRTTRRTQGYALRTDNRRRIARLKATMMLATATPSPKYAHLTGNILSVLTGTRRGQNRSGQPTTTVRPTMLNGATSTRFAVAEWVLELQQVAATKRSRPVHASITREYNHVQQLRRGQQLEERTPHGTRDWINSPRSDISRPFTVDEIKKAIGRLKQSSYTRGPPIPFLKAMIGNHDNPGMEDYHPTRYKAAIQHLTALANGWLNGQSLPDDLLTLSVRPIHKRGDPTQFSNWRLITPGHSLLWLLLTAVATRLTNHLEHHAWERTCSFVYGEPLEVDATLPDIQAGFRPKRGTTDTLLLAEESLMHAHRERIPSAQLFIDSSAAFDTVPHKVIYTSLFKHGVRGRMLDAIYTTLTQIRMEVGFGATKATTPVFSACGTQQGLPISPLLYIVSVTDLAAKIKVAAGVAAALTWTLPLEHDDPPATHTLASHFYADDIKITLSADMRTLCTRLRNVANTVSNWFDRHQMEVNVRPDCSKTCLALNTRAVGVQDRNYRRMITDLGLQIQSQNIPILDPGRSYKDLGMHRTATYPTARTGTRRSPPSLDASRDDILATNNQAKHHLIYKMRAIVGQLLRANAPQLQPLTARTVYTQYALPNSKYGLELWCHTPIDTRVKPRGGKLTAEKLHEKCVRLIAGRGPVSGVSMTCLEPAVGCVPLWAHALYQQAQTIARFMRRHPHDNTRSALRTATYAVATGRPYINSWLNVVLTTLKAMCPDLESMDYIHADLRNAEGTTREQPAVAWIWREGDPDEEKRTLKHLKNCINKAITFWWAQLRGERLPTEPTQGYKPEGGNRPRSSLTETRMWLAESIPRIPFPLMHGKRNDVYYLRLMATAGLGYIVDYRNFRTNRRDTACPLCRRQVASLVHVISHCQETSDIRYRTWQDCTNLIWTTEEDNATQVYLDSLTAATDQAHAQHEQAARDWACVTLGVPIPKGTRETQPKWHQLWYSGEDDAKKPQALRWRKSLLGATSHLLRTALRRTQLAIWEQPGAYVTAANRKLMQRWRRAREGDHTTTAAAVDTTT